MIKEEWRAHSTFFGNLMFFLFPIFLIILAFFGTLLLPMFIDIIPISYMILFIHYLFVLFGMSVGAFGLFGREIMNRRFGQASLIAYSSRSLPVSERFIFFNFFVKDLIYYFLLWILPFVLGISFALIMFSINLTYSLIILLTFTLSFLIGLSILFLLSTIYVHSSKLLLAILLLFGIMGLFSVNYLKIDLLTMLPSYEFFVNPSINPIFISLLLIIIPCYISIIFLKVDYPEKIRRFKNSLNLLSNWLKFTKYSHFMSKDYLDLMRSEGGVGKIIFSFIFPLVFVLLLIFIFLKFIPVINFIVVFTIFLGVLSSSMYNWLTEFDLFTAYSFLPVKVSTIIKSKIRSYILINIISVIILIFIVLWVNQFIYIIPLLITFLSVSSFTLAMTLFLTGLFPNIFLYNVKIFIIWLISIIPILLILIFISVVNVFCLFVSILLIPLSFYLIKLSYKKWDNWQQPSF